MRFTQDVAIPDALVRASTEGRLVLFVGAGISLNQPSALPSFVDLARALGKHMDEELTGTEPPDAFIGRLVDRESTIRDRAVRILSAPGSHPNANHKALVRLAASSAVARIVTTNFDDRLAEAAAELGLDLGDRYNAPAVPLARDFSGLVHLHGSVLRPPRDLVLTDADFGRAYLTDGWARRFVQELFLSRVVLFVGYSHDDTTMKYVARALPPTTSRFALTDIPDDPKWTELGITAVAYPPANDHAAIAVAIDAWSEHLRMGQLDVRQRVHAIVKGGPPKTPVDEDFIRDAIESPVGVRAFVEKASGTDWLAWAEQQPVFQAIFKPDRPLGDSSAELTRWFVGTYLATADQVDPGLLTVARFGPYASLELLRACSFFGFQVRQTDPNRSAMLALLADSVLQPISHSPEERWLISHGNGLAGLELMPFLRRALTPRLLLGTTQRWWASDADVVPLDVDVRIRWSSSTTHARWLFDAVQPMLATRANELVQLFEQSLRDAYELLEVFGAGRRFDEWSFHRSAVEPHSQDQQPRFESVIIDGLRDSGARVAEEDPALILRWLNDRHALFRRIGVHLLRTSAKFTADEQITILLERTSLWDSDLKHELFHALRSAVPGSSHTVRTALLGRILEGPPDFDAIDQARLHRRQIFDILEWLSRDVKDWPELNDALARILVAEPDMGVRDNADFDHYMTGGTWGGKLPMEVDSFLAEIETLGASDALVQLIERDYPENDFDQPTWDDAASLVRQTVTQHPELGAQLIEALHSADPKSREVDLISATLRGWSEATLSDDSARSALSIVEQLPSSERYVRPIAAFLLSLVERGVESRPPDLLAAADACAAGLWEMYAPTYDDEFADDWMLDGLNTWPGFLAQYWVNHVRLGWRAAGETWGGLSTVERDQFTLMLAVHTRAGRGPYAIVTRDVYFLYGADKRFAIDELFPCFDAAADDRATHAWAAFLNHPRFTDDMLDAGFWELLLAAATDGLDQIDRSIEGQLSSAIGSALLFSHADSLGLLAALDRLANAHPERISGVIRAIEWIVDEGDDDKPMQLWEKRLKTMAAHRMALPADERSAPENIAWADLALRLHPVIVEALALTSEPPSALSSRTPIDDLPRELVQKHADLLATTLSSRVSVTSTLDPGTLYGLHALIQQLVEVLGISAEVKSLVEAIVASGVPEAASWLD